MIVGCLGSSTTAGKGQAYDWVGSLARNLAEKHVQSRNFGVGGDLAYNALQRVSEVVSSRVRTKLLCSLVGMMCWHEPQRRHAASIGYSKAFPPNRLPNSIVRTWPF